MDIPLAREDSRLSRILHGEVSFEMAPVPCEAARAANYRQDGESAKQVWRAPQAAEAAALSSAQQVIGLKREENKGCTRTKERQSEEMNIACALPSRVCGPAESKNESSPKANPLSALF